MKRRRFLRIAGATAVSMSAGCGSNSDGTTIEPRTTQSSTDTGTPTPSPTASPVTTTAVQHLLRFQSRLSNLDIEIRHLGPAESADVIQLRYVSEKQKYEEIGAEIGRISGLFFRGVREGWSVTRLNATIVTDSGSPRATWYAKVEWFRQFQDDEITAEQLSLKVLDTLERPE